jgi:hypothetical protein
MDELRRKILAGQAKLPEGWGKSTVNGQTILTAPSQAAVSAAPLGHSQSHQVVGETNAYGGPIFESEVEPDEPFSAQDAATLEQNMLDLDNGIKYVEENGKRYKYMRDVNDENSIYTTKDGLTLFDNVVDQQNNDEELRQIYARSKK